MKKTKVEARFEYNGLGFPVIFLFGWDTIRSGIRGLFTFYFNMDSLISLGTIIAYITGILTFFMEINDYSGVSSMIMAIFVTGKYIEAKARGKASQEIKPAELRPDQEQPQDQKEGREERPEPLLQGQMSQENALRILNALKESEQELQFLRQPRRQSDREPL